MTYEEYLSEFTDYKPITNYWDMFSIADWAGESEIKALFLDIFKSAKTDYKLITELAMVLNHKSWQHAAIPSNSRLAVVYDALWKQVDEYAVDALSGSELSYYYRVTD